MTPLLPHVAQRGGITTITYDWSYQPVLLSVEAIRSILSICAKFDARSARVGQCGVHIRLDTQSSSSIRDRVAEILAAAGSWKRVTYRPKFPRELTLIRGNGDARTWDYEQYPSPVEVMYESAGT